MEDITSFDLGWRDGICIVAKDNFIYFLGGYYPYRHQGLNNAGRYDLNTNTWDKIAALQRPRIGADGAVLHGQIYVAGCDGSLLCVPEHFDISCEVHHEATNEWHFISTRREKDDVQK